MACFAVPAAAAIIVFALRKFSKSGGGLQALNLLLAGGAVMLVIDHLWNGELSLIGENVAMDLLLGFAMTAGVFAFWGLTVLAARPAAQKAAEIH